MKDLSIDYNLMIVLCKSVDYCKLILDRDIIEKEIINNIDTNNFDSMFNYQKHINEIYEYEQRNFFIKELAKELSLQYHSDDFQKLLKEKYSDYDSNDREYYRIIEEAFRNYETILKDQKLIHKFSTLQINGVDKTNRNKVERFFNLTLDLMKEKYEDNDSKNMKRIKYIENKLEKINSFIDRY